MSTTTLYETTPQTGTVSSTNLTSLYSSTGNFTTGTVNSSVYSVNGGLGVTVNPTTGNVVVSIGQDVATTANVTFANVTATGNLSNNYFTLANSVGSNGQVLTTNGAGVTTWTTPSSLGLVSSVTGSGAGISVSPTTGAVVVSNTGVTSIVAGTNISISSATGAVTVNATDTNTTYAIDASSTTGGANLNLVGSDATTDSVKFAGSGDTTITRTDANTITISSTSGTTIPNGTAQGQVLYWNGSAWTANSTITSAAAANRLTAVYNNTDAGVNNAIFARKDYTTSTYTTGDGTGIAFQLDSNSQALNQLATISVAWDATAPTISLNTNINNNTAGPYVSVGSFTSAQATLPGDLEVTGGDITTNVGSGGIANLYNSNAIGTINIGNSVVTEVNIGNAGSGKVFAKTPLFETNYDATIGNDLTVNGGLNVDSGTLYVDKTNNRVGINTTAPLQELTVNAGGDGYCQIGMENTERTWLVTNNDGDNLISYSVVTPSPFSVVNRLQFDATGGNQWFNSGRLGVNNSAPTVTLDVTGDGKFSGTISTEGVTINLTTPVHQGQLLYVSDDATPTITNSSTINFASTTYRPNFQQDSGVYGRTASGAQVSNNTGAVAYTTGDGGSLLLGIQSNSQALNSIGALATSYNTSGDHFIRLNTSINGFSPDQATSIITSNTLVFPTAHGFSIGSKLRYQGPTQNGLIIDTTYYVIATGFTTTQCQISLTLGGAAVALTNGTGLSLWFYTSSNRVIGGDTTTISTDAKNLILNVTNTGIAGVDATIQVERGTSGANPVIKWNEGTGRWQDTFDGTNYFNLPNQNLDTTDDVNFASVIVDGITTYNSQTTTTTAFTPVSISATSRLSQKSIITIIDNVSGEMHMLEALTFRKGTTAYLTTYAEMYSSAALATFTATGTGGFTSIIATPLSTNSTTFNVARISLD